MELLEFLIRIIADFSLVSTHPLHRVVVEHHNPAILCDLNIQLDGISLLRRAGKSRKRILLNSLRRVPQTAVRIIPFRKFQTFLPSRCSRQNGKEITCCQDGKHCKKYDPEHHLSIPSFTQSPKRRRRSVSSPILSSVRCPPDSPSRWTGSARSV